MDIFNRPVSRTRTERPEVVGECSLVGSSPRITLLAGDNNLCLLAGHPVHYLGDCSSLDVHSLWVGGQAAGGWQWSASYLCMGYGQSFSTLGSGSFHGDTCSCTSPYSACSSCCLRDVRTHHHPLPCSSSHRSQEQVGKA